MDSYVAPVRFHQNFHDSPLDFSTKNKILINHTHSDEDEDIVDVESSPKSKLRNILKKGGGGGGVLNLSKGEEDGDEEDLSPRPHSSSSRSWSRASSPLSPSMEQQAVLMTSASADNNNSHLVPEGGQQIKIQAQMMQVKRRFYFIAGGNALSN
jgi:hypothetical protein